MSYRSLLFCPDDKTARIVTQVLTEVDFRVEPCNEPFAAVKKLMAEHFDAIVVDCENEQNAALLFKSAHNSDANQSSLAVAVVEGQSGVAKAFRIGANLVLTKPINMEQSKGTLRVARGLLRKTDAARGSTTPPSQSAGQGLSGSAHAQPPASTPSAKPTATPFSSQTPLPMTTASGLTLEREHEEGPTPDPTEAALLESMPDPLASRQAAISPGAAPLPKEYPWQPVAKPMAEPMATALQQAAEAAGKSEFGSSNSIDTSTPIKESPAIDSPKFLGTVSHPVGTGSGQGAAAAPALEKIVATPKPASIIELEPPSFSSLGAEQRSEDLAAGGSKKLLIAAVIIVAVGVAAYVIWPKMNSDTHSPASERATVPAKALPQELALPTPPVEAQNSGADRQPAKSQNTQSDASRTPDITLSTAETKPSAETKVGKNNKTSDVAPDKVVSTLPRPDPVVVKSEGPKPSSAAPAPEPEEPPAPGLLAAKSSPDDGAISGIVSAPEASMPQPSPQTLKVSQGVAQGLVMKRVQPVYPQRAQQARIQGAVELSAAINKDGNITNLKVISGDPILTQAAVDAVKQWKYRPYLLDGQPVEIQTQITVNFKLP